MDEMDHRQSVMPGIAFLRKWRAMPPADQSRPWRWEVDRDALLGECQEAARAILIELQPAGAAAIREAYEALADTWQAKKAEGADNRARMWVDVFCEWPAFALKAATIGWADRDTAYMPTPGQFKAIGQPLIDAKRADLSDLQTIMRTIRTADRHQEQIETRPTDPEIAIKMARLTLALRRGENLKALRAAGEI